jgi:hypothetical protein
MHDFSCVPGFSSSDPVFQQAPYLPQAAGGTPFTPESHPLHMVPEPFPKSVEGLGRRGDVGGDGYR